MPRITLIVDSPVIRTPRVMQLEGIFDIPPTERSGLRLNADLPLDERPWSVGLIVGPSGSGKSSIARTLFGDVLATQSAYGWPTDRSVLDGFPAAMGIKDVVGLLSSVGFSSPPSWVRPFHVLSTGEQFRVSMARLLAESSDCVVVDEFTSVVDRTVAQIGSHAIAKTVRARKQQFVAVTCHEDVEAWLDPEWVYRPATNAFLWRSLQRRPPITLTVRRCHRWLWGLFRQHHYLTTEALNTGQHCFLATWEDRPVGFCSVLRQPNVKRLWRLSRTVVLPDYQGAGIGLALTGMIGRIVRGLGDRLSAATAHPAMIRARAKSPEWRITHRPHLGARQSTRIPTMRACAKSVGRLVTSFEFVGPALAADQARVVWDDNQFSAASSGS